MNIRAASAAAALTAFGLATGCSKGTDLGNATGARLIDTTVTATVPPVAKEIAIPPNYGVHDTYVRDGIAVVCAWNTGLILYDVGNGMKGGSPSNPVEISRLITSDDGVPGGPAVHNAWWFHNPVTSENRYVFIGQEGPATIPTTSTGDIHVVDVSDLTNPHEVAFYHMNVSPAAGTHNFWMDEQAQTLFAAYYNGGVVALNVSGTLSGDLSSREIAKYKPSTNPFMWGVQLSGGSLYALDMLSGLYQLKFTNGTFTTASGGNNVNDRYSSDLWVNGSYAYTGTWGGAPRGGLRGNALKIWRLDASGAPTLADSVTFAGISTVSDVKGSADGKLLVVSAEGGSWGGLFLFNLADPVRPALIGRTRVVAGLHTAKVADINGKRYVFAARNPSSTVGPALVIYDVSGITP